MKETCLIISRRIFRPHRIAWHVVLLCLMSYSLANAQSSTIPLSDNKVEPTVALVTAALVATVIVIAIFSVLVVQCCSDTTAATQAWSTAGGQSRLSGLEPTAVEAFPVLVYSAVKQMKIGEASLECAVCLSEFEDDETLRLLPKCNHAFHPACIGMWLASHVTCPVCRANLTPESADISKDSTPQATTEPNQQNSAAQCNEIAITINEEQNRDSQSSASQQSNLPQRTGVLEKLTRSHSTGHSLGLLGEEYTERYTLRLPDEVRRQLMWRAELTRARSFDVFSAREWSSRRGYRIGGGGGGERIGRSERWVFSLTPPFVSRGGDHAGDSVNGCRGEKIGIPFMIKDHLKKNEKDEEGEKVSALMNSHLLKEIDSLVGLLEEICQIPDGDNNNNNNRNRNNLADEIMDLVGGDMMSAINSISIRVDEFKQRLDCLSFGDSIELGYVLKRLEDCKDRILDLSGGKKELIGSLWCLVSEIKSKVTGCREDGRLLLSWGRGSDRGTESARFGNRSPSFDDDSLRFSSARFGLSNDRYALRSSRTS